MKKIRKSFIIFLSVILVYSTTITVFADNAGGGGGGGGTATDKGFGASESKCGFRMYVVDEQGNLKSKVIDLVYKTPDFDIFVGDNRFKNGLTSESDVYIMPSDMPKPFYYSGTYIGNGLAVKKWMRDLNSDGEQNIASLIYNYLGADTLKLFKDQSQEYFCVLEPIAWHGVYKGTSSTTNTGTIFYGTFYNWMQLYQENGISKPFTYQLDNNVLGRCLTLERDQPNLGLSVPSFGSMLSLSTVGNQGFGIQLYSNLDQKGTHTWDYPLGDTPGQAPISKGSMNIVKNYRTEIREGQYTDDGCFIRNLTDSTITIEDEKSYVVVGWKITDNLKAPDSINWESTVPGSVSEQGTSPKTVTVKKPSTTLYVLLEKQEIKQEELEADYRLRESQITRAISLKTTDKGKDILDGHEFIWDFASLNNCSGHTHPGGHSGSCPADCTKDHGYTSTCNFSLNNTDWDFKLKNENKGAYPKNIAYNGFWTDFTNEHNLTRSTLDSGNKKVDDTEYKLVLHRGSDSLTIAQWKNQNEDINSLENFNTANSKNPTRKKSDYTESINVNLVDDSPDKTTSSSGDEGCNPSDDAELENPLSVDASILYETYSGLQNGGKLNTDINTSEMLTIGTVGDKIFSGKMVDSGLQFSFHPYIQMRYDTMDSKGNITKDNFINILGEYKRSMKPNDYAEIEWSKSNKPNMTLHSLQWSTHAQAVKDWGATSVLPGGAAMTLGIKKQDMQVITVRSFQCILDGKGREQVEKTWQGIDGYTKESALQYHESYVQSIITGLENLSVEQWQNKDANADPFKGIPVYNEAEISRLSNGSSKASYEEKYYFKNERGNADSGCLDVYEGETSTEYYTFSSDISGNILMNGKIILDKGQDAGSLSGTALKINSRTSVVAKLIDSIERNTGNDPDATWVSDGHWLNEAFDGITVAVSITKLQTGYIAPTERTSVLDPRLTPKSKGQKDMLNHYMVGQFKMKDFSSAYGSKYVLGEFKGNPVLMNGMDMLYFTKKFYIGNITTQDLH